MGRQLRHRRHGAAATGAEPLCVLPQARQAVARQGDPEITVKPYAKGLRLIKHHSYKVRIRVWVTYTPTGGTQHTIGFEGARSVILTP